MFTRRPGRSVVSQAVLGGALLPLLIALLPAVQAQSEKAQSEQTRSEQTQLTQADDEIWVGWLETKAQNLRLIVNLSSTSLNSPSGTISSPDQASVPLPITKASIDDQRQLSFQVSPEGIGSATYSFQGKLDGDTLVGELEQGGAKLPIQFNKTKTLPEESKERLGADSAWIGSLDVGTRKVPLRFRIYNSAPYASAANPRVLFDSLLENANGFPATVSVNDKGMFEFSVPAIPGNAKYIAELSADGKTLKGKFQQGFLPLQLDMQRAADLASNDPTKDAMVQFLSSLSTGAEKVAEPVTNEAPATTQTPQQAAIQAMEKKLAKDGRVTLPNGIQEESFVVDRFDSRKPLLNELGKRADNTFQLAGTITYPKGFNANSQYPAVILVTGSGPQDRDETIGRHKPFREIASYLAAQGMVVLRYDDRGVGQSTGDFLSATSKDFADDALAVWQFTREIEGIDRSRVGILGHSEGGIIGPMVAAWQREVAFMILIAPPVLPGAEILSSQIDRIAELEGVSPEDRAVANSLQKELQEIALRYPADDEDALSDVRKAIVQRWETLSRLSQTNTGGDDQAKRKQQLIDAISAQFRGLQSPWMRHFLAYDPSSNWVLFDCPVLAVWAEKDTQVLFEANRKKLQEIITHNTNLKADLVVLPGLNHLLQRAQTGLPDEYDRIEQAIDPLALEFFGNWLRQAEILP